METTQLKDITNKFSEESKNKQEAFLKGMLFGLNFVEILEPSWLLIKTRLDTGYDFNKAIKIEKEIIYAHAKIKQQQIKLVELILKEMKESKSENEIFIMSKELIDEIWNEDDDKL